MAGIAGIQSSRADVAEVEMMLERIRHRGPDHVEMHENGCLGGVVSSRLSPARGTGFARDEGVAVLFDGEVYNPRQDGQSDADVVLALYREHGRRFPAYLAGVFGCAVLTEDEVLLARDPVGVRPMYWSCDPEGTTRFASEMKALAGLADVIEELPPATTFSSKSGLAGYLPRYPEVEVPADVQAAIARVRETVIRAVERRLADGAVGACLLSGGLDSSIIAAVANEIRPGLPVVTVGMEGAPDLENAMLMAAHLGVGHHVEVFGPEQIEKLVPKAVYCLESFDEDCVSGAIANLVASATASHLTNCILSGEGGDELFGGYHLLKTLPTESERLQMMQKLIAIAYNTAVQRLDRAMMGNAINYRTPFLDTEVIALALQVPVRWKIHNPGDGNLIEKWILREAFKDLLPCQIYLREKLRFSGGTGTDGVMDRIAEGKMKAEGHGERTQTATGYPLSSPKEQWYYELFKERFPGLACENLVGRWDPNK